MSKTEMPKTEMPDWFVHKKTRGNLIVARWVPAALVGLPVLVLFAIVVYPTVWMFYHAFQDTNMMRLFQGNWSFVGWDNFGAVLSSKRFGDSVVHLAQYLLFGCVLQVILGTVLALTLYELVRKEWLRVLLLIAMVLPMMLPPSQKLGLDSQKRQYKNFIDGARKLGYKF